MPKGILVSAGPLDVTETSCNDLQNDCTCSQEMTWERALRKPSGLFLVRAVNICGWQITPIDMLPGGVSIAVPRGLKLGGI